MSGEYQEPQQTEARMKVPTECPICGAKGEVECDQAGYLAWKSGDKDALPELSPSERERLETGLCEACYDRLTDEEGGGYDDD
jgi:hypothetical protein